MGEFRRPRSPSVPAPEGNRERSVPPDRRESRHRGRHTRDRATDRTPMPGKPQPKPEAQEPTGRLSNDAFWWPAILVAASCIVFSVTLKIDDPDVWQHLVVGKSMWAARAVRGVHLWSWPGYGTREVTESWLYCAVLYQFWKLGGVWGLFLWRWATVLGTF